MEKFIELLNERTNNKFDFSLKSALLKKSADFCDIQIFYKDGIILKPEDREFLHKEVLSVLPKDITYNIQFVKNYISEETAAVELKGFMAKNYPSISFKIENIILNQNVFEINLFVDELSFDHAEKRHIDFEISKHFKQKFKDYDFITKFKPAVVYVEDELQKLKENYREEEVNIYENRIINVTDLVPIIGEPIEEPATYIKDKLQPQTGVVICGKVRDIKFKVVKTKRKTELDENSKAKTEKTKETVLDDANQKTEYERKIYFLQLEDFTGIMKCVYLSNKETQAKMEKLDTDSVIIVRGNTQIGKFSGEIEMNVRDISYCNIPQGLTEYIEWKKEKPFYEFVVPEKMVIYEQNDLMSFANEEIVPEFLKNKTFVCYDFETTGLHFGQGDKIIEIGAVKIENGKITEKFMSFVDPEKPIPPESSAISGIVDSDVAGAPKDYQVLQDFYKFTRGAIIIGYNNINFDNVFLIGQGKNTRWNFDNETADVYKYATKFVTGVKNYKLGTIASKLGVVLDNAHRAVYDALATAEVFLKIAKQNDLSSFKN